MKRIPILALAVALSAIACGDDDPSGPTITPPVLTGAAPAEGTVGSEVRIDGTGIDAGATVEFDELVSDSVEIEGGVLYAFAPAGLTEGAVYDIVVTNPDGGADTLLAAFTAIGPQASRVNGVSKPTGLHGMTIIVEGNGFGDALNLSGGKVWFTTTTGTDIEALIADSASDWTDDFIVTTVPAGVTDTSYLWVETAVGVSDSIEFRLIQSGTFSPSTINWAATTALPQGLQGLGAVFVPVEEGTSPANYVLVVAGGDSLNVATNVVYRATVQASGALGESWDELTALPAARAYHATAAATGYTAALDTTTTAAFVYVLGGLDAAGAASSTVYRGHMDLSGAITDWAEATALPVPLHSAGAVLFRGFLYVAGGVGADSVPVSTVYRAAVAEDGSLGDWEELSASLPVAAGYHSLLNFGPFLYAVGGDSTKTSTVGAAVTNGELGDVYKARINLRTGDLAETGWEATTFMGKGRSKHSTVFAGGDLFATSGLYSGQAGSSENIYGSVASDGSVEAWNGATGSNTIGSLLGYHLYNQAAITFIDAAGNGHVLVLGGARRDAPGEPSAAVVYY